MVGYPFLLSLRSMFPGYEHTCALKRWWMSGNGSLNLQDLPEKLLNEAILEEFGTPEHLTDLGNARRLVRLHGKDLRYSHESGWLVWDGKRWTNDETGEVKRRAKETVRNIYKE